MTLCDTLAPDQRPRERLLRHGAAALSSAELLALMLGSGTRNQNALELAQNLLAHFEGVYGPCWPLRFRNSGAFMVWATPKAAN